MRLVSSVTDLKTLPSKPTSQGTGVGVQATSFLLEGSHLYLEEELA